MVPRTKIGKEMDSELQAILDDIVISTDKSCREELNRVVDLAIEVVGDDIYDRMSTDS